MTEGTVIFQTASGVKLEVRNGGLYTENEEEVRKALETDLASDNPLDREMAEKVCKLMEKYGVVAEAHQYELNWLEHGQRHAYGDSYYTCEIHTNKPMTDAEILSVTKETGRLPYEEWRKRSGNMSDYFKGYYTIEKTSYGYLYKGVYPYDD